MTKHLLFVCPKFDQGRTYKTLNAVVAKLQILHNDNQVLKPKGLYNKIWKPKDHRIEVLIKNIHVNF
jgi:hypothetical protein